MSTRYATVAALARLERSLTDRDVALLHSVSELRFVSGSQLARLHFADHDDQARARATRRATLRLARLGALTRLPRSVGGVRAGSAGFVYGLGLVGQRFAAVHGWQPPRPPRRSHVPGMMFLAHVLQVAELHTRLTEADRAGRLELLELSAEPACWRAYAGGIGAQAPTTLKPDSYVKLGAGEYEDSYFIEVDMGSEGSRTLLTKLRAYLTYQASGVEQAERGVFPKTLWLTPDEARAEVVRGCVRRLPVACRDLFAVAEFDALLTTLNTTEVTHT
ncbi:MAG: replication-relaxation family protein [Actinobacteria bacterium]|nr:replication-relaxation family protein [Actinomycetota bacterium]